MSGVASNRRSLLWLVLVTVAMAVAMAALLIYELAQQRAIELRTGLGTDSVTAIAYQFEREYSRLQHTLELQSVSDQPLDKDRLSLRFDIFLSRLELLHNSPTTADLVDGPEFSQTLPKISALSEQMERLLAAPRLNRAEVQRMHVLFAALAPDVQAMGHAADSVVARTVEQQKHTMRDQNTQIVRLTVAQLLLLLMAAFALYVRHQRQTQERRALELLTDELREARSVAEAANRGKSQFLTNMSHELRTPFNGLLGMLHLLEESQVSPQQIDYLNTAKTSAQHLLALLNDILDVSTLDSGHMTLKPERFNFPAFVREIQMLMAPRALEKGLSFAMRVDESLPQWLHADAARVRQILVNIIHNAIKFTEAGAVTVDLAVQAVTPQRLEIVCAVRDTGIGMDAQVLAHLFQRFYQVDGSSTRRFGGTGLGLEISQSLAHMMGGEITVQSEAGAGSCFTVRLQLPLATPPATVRVEAPSLEGKRILVVEDHPINQKLIATLLARMGCEVVLAENGQIALEQVQSARFDAVLMDVNMPVMDGLTATRRIRALAGPERLLPIVVVTADVMNDAQGNAQAAGASDFMSKPVHFDQLREKLHDLLGTASPAATL